MPSVFQLAASHFSSRGLAGHIRDAILLGMLCTLTPVHAKDGGGKPVPPVPVAAAIAQQQSMPVWIEAQGTVAPLNYANVMPRVAGLLQSINFREGQPVKAGQLLATLDPKPYQVLLEQAKAQTMRDQAQLGGAQSDLLRYETLLAQDSIAAQQVTDQRAVVAQLMGTVAADKAAQDNAQPFQASPGCVRSA
jgi:multidrug efflux system membrane fusion protein